MVDSKRKRISKRVNVSREKSIKTVVLVKEESCRDMINRAVSIGLASGLTVFMLVSALVVHFI